MGRMTAFENTPIPAPVVSGAETIRFGLNPLIIAAAPLLQLLGRLRTTSSAPNVDDLRERTVRQVRQYARRQLTWFRADSRVTWIPPDPQLAIQRLGAGIMTAEAS